MRKGRKIDGRKIGEKRGFPFHFLAINVPAFLVLRFCKSVTTEADRIRQSGSEIRDSYENQIVHRRNVARRHDACARGDQ
jgi:hypothetical protein